jgi:hypothetical protein
MDDYANYHCFGFNPEKEYNEQEEWEEEETMAKKSTEYVSHAIPTEITATSRCAVKIRDNYYTIEATEKRSITNDEALDMDKEWKMLFDEVNAIVDDQCKEIVSTFK